MAFYPKDLGAYRDFLDSQAKISKVMSKSSKDFASGFKDALVAKRDLVKLQKQANKLEQEEIELKKKLKTLDGDAKKAAEARLAAIKEERKEVDKLLQQQKALSAALSSQVKSVKNLTLAVGRDLVKGVGKVLVKAKELGKEFSEMDDSMRRTAVNVGLVGKQFNMLRKNAYKAALVTDRIGVGAKELVETYGSYVDEVGRLIPMTEKAGKALAYMSKGTALGAQGAAQMAASMEVFGMSIESTAGYVEDVSNMSAKMGVNTGKTLKLIQQNLRKAQTVRFKGGVDGMAKMAAKAVAIRADMSATLGFAQDLWEPEKAIETAAQLQMMGGAFARMADPIQLMFNARNNPAKLMEDLANAAGSVVRRSREGVYEIPTMELQKLKQVAEATGQDFESIVESAKTMARRNDIGKALNPNIKGDAREFVKSIATFDKKKGGFVITVDGETKKVSELSQKQVEAMIIQDKSLKERAEQAQGFMTRIQNLLSSLKNLAMSFFAGMDTTLGPLLDSLTGRGEGSLASLSEQMYTLGQNFGEWIATTAKPFIEKAIPMIGALTGKLTTAVAGTADFFKNQLIPATQAAIEWIKGKWPFIKEMFGLISSVSGVVWSLLKGIKKYFGAEGVLAAILLVRFPGILRAAIGLLTGGVKGIASMFSGSKSVPQAVYIVGGGGPGGGGPMDMMGGRYGRIGRVGGRIAPMGRGGRVLRGIGNLFGGRNTMVGRGFRGMAARTMGYGGGFMRGGNMYGPLTKSGRPDMRFKVNKLAAKGGKGLGKSMLGSVGGRLARGMSAGGPLALLGVGAEVGRMFMDDPDSTMGKTLGVLGTTASDAAMGMMIGSMLGPLGTAVGGIIGGIVGFGRSMYREITTKGKKDFDMAGAQSSITSGGGLGVAGTSRMADGAIMPDGNVIKTAKGQMYSLAPRDVAVIGQPGGGNYGGSVSGGVNVNIGGTINLSSGGTSISLDGLLNDPVFKAEITKIVVENMKSQNR